jgi:hypothetical protein
MKKNVIFLFLLTIFVSCSGDKKKNMEVNVTIKDFKKGTAYLQKYVDSTLISVDSIAVNGSDFFTLNDNVEGPEIYVLSIDKIPDEKILFFGEKGTINISTKLPKFQISAQIEGSVNQQLLDEHNAMIQQFNGRFLDIMKERFDAQKINDTATVNDLNTEENSLIRRKYLYSTNFAVKNASKEVAPYIAITQLFNANIKLLDTINNSLSTDIKNSKYGKELQAFITEIKNSENQE